MNVKRLACTCTCSVSLPLLDGSIWAFFSLLWLNNSLVLYRCSLSCAITLCPSLPPLHSSFSPLFLPRSPCVQFNHGAVPPWGPPPPFSSCCYILWGEMYFYGVSLTFFLSWSPLPSVSLHCSLLFPLVPPSASISPPFPLHLSREPHTKSHHHLAVVSLFDSVPSPTSLVIRPFHLSSRNKGTRQSNIS